MATIDIFPLSINGVAAPLNLLYKLFTNPLKPDNLLYPLDLASNPIYGHAVQFRIKDFTYNVSLTNFTGQGARPTPTDKTLSTISLYMPDTVATNFQHNYTQTSLTDMLGLGAFLGSTIADSITQRNGTEIDTAGNKANLIAGGAAFLANSVKGGDWGGLVGNVFKQVPNPQLQMLYKGIGLREFQFEFKFLPTSRKEAEAVDKIIQSFTYYSVPKILGPTSHQYLQPPQLFDISFAFTGGSSLSSAISQFFGNLGSSILGGPLFSDLFGGNQANDIGGASGNAKVYEIYHPCILENMSVDYAPNGWAAFDDGNPVEIRLTLQFRETDIVDKDTIAKTARGSFLKGSAAGTSPTGTGSFDIKKMFPSLPF